MSNFINIVAGGTCWTCLLSLLQMVGNVPDLLTPPGASAAGAPQPMQTIPFTPLCVYECAFVPVCVYTFPHGHLSFLYSSPFLSSATHILSNVAFYQLRKLLTSKCCINPILLFPIIALQSNQSVLASTALFSTHSLC